MGLTFNTPLEIMSFDKDIMTLSDRSKVKIVAGRPPGWNPKGRVVLSKQQTSEPIGNNPGHDFSGVVHLATKIDKDGKKVGSPVAITPLDDDSTLGVRSGNCTTFKDFKRFDKKSTIWKVNGNNILLLEDASQWLLSDFTVKNFELDWMPDEIVKITGGVSENKGYAGKGSKPENRICEIKNITREETPGIKTKPLLATFVER